MNIQPLLKPKLKPGLNIPYGGQFKIDRPDLGFVGVGTTFEQLMVNVRKWRYANGYQNGLGLDQEVEREICKEYSAECYEADSRIPPDHSLTVSHVLQGTKMMIRFKAAGSPLVSPEEATRRASVCVRCPYNKDFSKPCSGICGELKDTVIALLGHNSTPHDQNLRACTICHCFNAAAVWLPLELQQSGLTDEQKAQFRWANESMGCWKGEGI